MNAGQKFKIACVCAYALIVGGLTASSAWYWQSSAPTRLSRDIEQNERLSDADLRSADQKEIAGHFARKAMAKDSEIRPSDVSDMQSVPPAGLAALATMTRTAGQKGLAKGDSVRLCLDGAAVGNPTVAEAATCDAATCLVTVRIAQLPKEVQVPNAAGRLRAIPATEPCLK